MRLWIRNSIGAWLMVALVSSFGCAERPEVAAADRAASGDAIVEMGFEEQGLEEQSATPRPTPDGVAVLADLIVHYQYEGPTDQDRAIVLIPGWASTIWSWHKQVLGLTDLGLPVIAIDLPGHGNSSSPENPEELTLDLFADAIRAVLDDAGIAQGIVLGHSNGASVALRFYRRYPERTAALGSVDGALRLMFDRASVEAMIEPMRGEGYREFVTQMIASMQSDGLTVEERQGLIDMAGSLEQPVLVQTVLATADPEMWSEEPIAVPLFVLKARQPSWNEEYEAALRAMAPEIDYIVWDGVGHFIQLERPGELRAALEQFLYKHGLGSS